MTKTRASADTLERKSFTFHLTKEVDEAGRFEGYAAVFGNVDAGRDVIEPGAFKKTLQENPTIPILWQHDAYEPIGVSVEMKEDNKGLHVVGQLTVGVQRADEARLLMQSGAIKGLSIGYRAIKPAFIDGVRRLKEISLKEWSPVTFPMNELATIETVKGHPLQKAEIVWEEESGFCDLREDIRLALNPNGTYGYYVQDVALDLGSALVQNWAEGRTYVVPFVIDENGDPKLAPASDWIEAEEAWVAADKAAVKLLVGDIEIKEGRCVLSAANRRVVEGAVKALQALLDAPEPAEKATPNDGAASTTVAAEIGAFAESLRAA